MRYFFFFSEDLATLGQWESVKEEIHCTDCISFRDSIILLCACPCPGEAVAPGAREAVLGKDMDAQTLETAALPRKGTAYSHVGTKQKQKMDGLLKSTDCHFTA